MHRKSAYLLSSAIYLAICYPADAGLFGNGKHDLFRGEIGGKLGPAEDKVKQESKNAVGNTVEAAETIVKTAERQVDSLGEVAKTTEQLLRDGKPIDAWIHLTTEPYKAIENNALRAVQESSMLRMASQFTANTFAPGIGGALVTTWYVGRTTGNIEDALKSGAVSYTSSSAFSAIGEGPVTGWGDGAGRAVASGVVGGTGTAIMGGNFEDGFESAAFASALKSGIEAYSEQPLDPKPGTPSISKGTTSECAPI